MACAAGVNVAARLEPLAEPGGICVSRVVRDQVRVKLGFGFEDLGQRQVKNIARSVHIFRVALDAGSEPKAGAVISGGGVCADRVTDSAGSAASRTARRAVPRKAIAFAGLSAGAALVGAAGLWSWTGGMRAAAPAHPSPVIGAPVLFEKDGVKMIPSAEATLAEQAKFLSDNPGVKAVIAAACAGQERARDGAWVVAELRANRVRGALRASWPSIARPGADLVDRRPRPLSPRRWERAQSDPRSTARIKLLVEQSEMPRVVLHPRSELLSTVTEADAKKIRFGALLGSAIPMYVEILQQQKAVEPKISVGKPIRRVQRPLGRRY